MHWARVWETAWPAADADAIVALYAKDAVFLSHPFRQHQAPDVYVR